MSSYQEPDYKELYLKLFRATEETINRLIEIQQQCEEAYLAAGEQKPTRPRSNDIGREPTKKSSGTFRCFSSSCFAGIGNTYPESRRSFCNPSSQ